MSNIYIVKSKGIICIILMFTFSDSKTALYREIDKIKYCNGVELQRVPDLFCKPKKTTLLIFKISKPIKRKKPNDAV